jgi:hypothetical protein
MSSAPIADDDYARPPEPPAPADIPGVEYLPIGPVVAHLTRANRLEREKRVLEVECEQLRARVRELEAKR